MDAQPVGAQYVRAWSDAGAFAVMVEGEPVSLLALDPLLVAGLARMLGVTWLSLVETPTADLSGALGLIDIAEQCAGVSHRSPVTITDALARFVRFPATNGRGD